MQVGDVVYVVRDFNNGRLVWGHSSVFKPEMKLRETRQHDPSAARPGNLGSNRTAPLRANLKTLRNKQEGQRMNAHRDKQVTQCTQVNSKKAHAAI